MISSSHELDVSSRKPSAEPGENAPTPLRNALIEIADLRSANEALHERASLLFSRLATLRARRGLPPPKLEQ